MIKWFQENDIADLKELAAWADVENHHVDAEWGRLPDDSVLFETRWSDKTGTYTREFVIYDNLNARATVIYDTEGGVKTNSKEYHDFRNYAFAQWNRLKVKRGF